MKEADRIARNQQRLATCYPTFAKRLARVIKRMEAMGLRPRIQDAWRSKEDQLKAFESGHSKLKFGFHNVTGADGRPEALAVDLLDDNAPTNPTQAYLLKLTGAALAEGLTTGAFFGLAPNLRQGILDAIAAGNWNAPVKISWDPTHIEPTDVTVAEARDGKRPA